MMKPSAAGRPICRRRRLLLSVLVLAGLALPVTAAQSAFPGANGKIAFAGINAVNADGSGLAALTDGGEYPAWSPDGSRIAFASELSGDRRLYVMNADGSGSLELTHPTGNEFDQNPSWSPDGTKIAYTSRDASFQLQIWVVNADGTNAHNLSSDAYDEQEPSWSPDGTAVAFTSSRDGNFQIYTMNASTGLDQTRVTNDPDSDLHPDWSPDGTAITFDRSTNLTHADIWKVDAVNGTETQLTNDPATDNDPSWSPDGTKIAFASNRNPAADWDIFTMNASDGSGQTNLTNNPGDDVEPDWQPLAGTIADTTPPLAGTIADTTPPLADTIADTTPPLISCASSSGAWSASNVSLACTASDSGSSLANPSDASFALATSAPSETETATAFTDSRSVCDQAGNCTIAGPLGPNKIDRKAPSIALLAPSNGAAYLLAQRVNARYSCSDLGSGVATCARPVRSGSRVDTATVGTKSFIANAADQVGNAATPVSAGYTVAFGVKRLSTTKTISLQLVDFNNANRSSAPITLTVTTIDGKQVSGHTFRYVKSTNSYTYNTQKLATGRHRLTFTASGDPTRHRLNFTT